MGCGSSITPLTCFTCGRDLREAPLAERKKLLKQTLSGEKQGIIRFSEHWIGRGKALFRKACETGLEGIIAKRIDEPYARAGAAHG